MATTQKKKGGEPGRLIRRTADRLLQFQLQIQEQYIRQQEKAAAPARSPALPPGDRGGGLPAAGPFLCPGLFSHRGPLHRFLLWAGEGADRVRLLAGAPGPSADQLYPGLPPRASGVPSGGVRPADAPDDGLHGPRADGPGPALGRSPAQDVVGERPGHDQRRRGRRSAGPGAGPGGERLGDPPWSLCWPSCSWPWGRSASPFWMWPTGSSTGPSMSPRRSRSGPAAQGPLPAGRQSRAHQPPGSGDRHSSGGRPPRGEGAGRSRPGGKEERLFDRRPRVPTPDQVLAAAAAQVRQPEPQPAPAPAPVTEPVPQPAAPAVPPEPDLPEPEENPTPSFLREPEPAPAAELVPAPAPKPLTETPPPPMPEVVREPAVSRSGRDAERQQAAQEMAQHIQAGMELETPPYQHPPLELLTQGSGELGERPWWNSTPTSSACPTPSIPLASTPILSTSPGALGHPV